MKSKILTGLIAVIVFVAVAYAASTKFTSVTITDTLSVGGASILSGNISTSGDLTASGNIIGSRVQLVGTVDVAVSTPLVVGQLVRTSTNVLYISTGTTNPTQWSKIGAQ